FLEHNKDVIQELGHHDYNFSFQFGSEQHYFRRGIYKPDLVFKCDDQYSPKTKPLSIEEYKTFLKTSYELSQIDSPFRTITSLFSRIWGKENLDVKRPLHNFAQQKYVDCITNTIKLFEEYRSIEILSEEVSRKKEEKTAITQAFKNKIISKPSKPQYNSHLATITAINNEIEDIKTNLAKYSVNIAEIANKEILELKARKDKLLSEKFTLDTRLQRVRNDLSNNKNIKSKHLSPLLKYFPDINIERLAEVESFHSNITKILEKELRSSERELSALLENITSEIDTVDEKLESLISNKKIENPSIIIDRVYGLSQAHAAASTEIEYFEKNNQIVSDFKEAREQLIVEMSRILEYIENVVNDKTRRYVTAIYNEERRSPILHLHQNRYSFEVVEDTGTGKAYSNLILLDLAFLEMTRLPFLIHDSVLFKNIQNDAVAELVDLYEKTNKQTFIAIDEIEKYGQEAESKLIKRTVIQLDNNNVLYIKDWRK
ncbi:MAG: DUF2326 domain-containing protein, partial [Chloroflexi bacterium]|nr:DUF2326 domain-containing protein [Chloroflexota bacterium]